MKSITQDNLSLIEIKKSLNESGWDHINRYDFSKGGDAPFHNSLGDFCISILRIYPEWKEIRILLNEEIKSIPKKLKILNQAKQDYADIIYRKCSKENEWFWTEIVEELFTLPLEKKYNLLLRRNITNKNKINVDKAKQFPITDLIDFNHSRMAKCIFHEDKTPSMHYYPKTNSVYCFSCNNYGDSIKVYMTINNCSFLEAVKALS